MSIEQASHPHADRAPAGPRRCRTLYPAAIFFLLLGLHTIAETPAVSVFDPQTGEITAWEENGRVVVADGRHSYSMEIPAPYWTYQSPAQLRHQVEAAPQGCVPGGGIPDRVLLVIRNKDAPTCGATLEKMPYRFFLRDDDDLQRYTERQENAVLDQMRGTGELIRSVRQRRDNMIVYTSYYTLRERDRQLRVILANFLVRPPGEEVLLYQIQTFAPPEWYAMLEEDFIAMIDSFRYTGQAARQFFVPDAPEEKLPFAAPQPGRQCGAGMTGALLGMVAFLAIYSILKRKKEAM